MEADLFDHIRRQAAEYIAQLQATAGAVATIDVLAGLAQLAIERRYCRPQIVTDNLLEIVDGRHPVLEQSLAQRFVPNDCRLDEQQSRFMIITGPNMAGKSTYIRWPWPGPSASTSPPTYAAAPSSPPTTTS